MREACGADAHTRVDVLCSSRHVQVVVDGVTIADSARPTVRFETGPLAESIGVAGLICLSDERVDLVVDGVLRERPRTAFA